METWLGPRPGWQRPAWAAVEAILGLRRLGLAYAPLAGLDTGAFVDAALEVLDVRVQDPPGAAARLRDHRGPLLVVANHPFGAVEALWLMRLLDRAGRDYKVLANRWLGLLQPLAPRLLGLEVLRTEPEAVRCNATALRAASR